MYANARNKSKRLIYRRKTMDFSTAESALIIRVTQKKFVIPRAKLEATKHTVLSGGYADNYSKSFRTLEEFQKVSKTWRKSTKRSVCHSRRRIATLEQIQTSRRNWEKKEKQQQFMPSWE